MIRVCARCGNHCGDSWVRGGGLTFCSWSCSNAWDNEHHAAEAAQQASREQAEAANRAAQAAIDAAEIQAQAIRDAEYARQEAEERARIDAEKNHFRPSIEKRVGHPVALDDIVKNERLGEWVAREERLAEVKAAARALESVTGFRFLSVINNLEQAEWSAKNNLWGIEIPWGIAMYVYDKSGGHPRKNGTWEKPDDLLPYQAVSLYLGKDIDGIDWRNFAIMPDGNVADMTVAREFADAKNDDLVLNYDSKRDRWTAEVRDFEKNVSPYVTVIPVYADGGRYEFDYDTMTAAGKKPSKAPPPLPNAPGGGKVPPPLPTASAGKKTPPPLPPTK